MIICLLSSVVPIFFDNILLTPVITMVLSSLGGVAIVDIFDMKADYGV
jgi:hypothetical protein